MSKHSVSPGLTPILHAATNPAAFGVLRGVMASLLSVVLMIGSTGWFVYRGFASDVHSNALDISGLGAQSGQQDEEDEAPPADSFAGRAINILVVGIDSRQGQTVDGIGTTDDVEGLRGDTTMLVHVSADRSRVQVVSIPRDLIVDIPSCTRTDGSVSGATTGMFNSAITIGANWGYDVASGIACTKATVEQMSGLNVDGFAVVDFSGFSDMINALGGVWYNLDEAVSDTDAGLQLDAGCQKLDGTQALAYARARYNLGDGSDISRIGRQQQLVGAIFREVLSKNFMTDLPSLLSFIQAALNSLQTSTNLSDINTDAGLLLSLTDIERANIEFVTLPWGSASWDIDRVVASEPLASELWEAVASDSQLPVDIEYTDGAGNVKTVTAPIASQSGQEEAGTATDEGGGTPAPADPSSSAADGTTSSTTDEATIQDQCPPTGTD
jgi:LCP family protein required for cell wall assembly